MKIWQKRILRLWLVFLLPLSLYFGYQAYENHISIDYWQEAVTQWFDSMYPDTPPEFETAFSFDEYKQMFDEAVIARDESVSNRKIYSILSLVLFFIPFISWILIFIGKWIWHASDE